MSAVLKPESAAPSGELQGEYLLTAANDGHTITGVEVSLTRALAVAHGLALGGWRVTVRNADPYLEDEVVYEVWSESLT